MSVVKRFFAIEIKQTILGLITLLIIGIPTYIVIFPSSPEGYWHLFSGFVTGLLLAALSDFYLVGRLLKPIGIGFEPVLDGQCNQFDDINTISLLKKLPILFFLRILFGHTIFVAVIPGIYLLYQTKVTHVFSLGEATIFVLVNAYLCIGHALVKIFLAQTLVRRIFLPFFQLAGRLPANAEANRLRINIRQKIMLAFLLLGIPPLLVITSISWYKLDLADREKTGNYLAASALDLAMAGESILRQENYRYLRTLPTTMNRHLLLIDKNNNLLYSNRKVKIIDLQRLAKEVQKKEYGWFYWEDISALVGYAWTPSGEALVVQAIHTSEVVSSIKYIQWVIFLLAGIGILNAATVGFLTSKYLSESIRLLVEGMKNVREGDFTTKLYYTSTDEFAVLGTGFNEMVQGLAGREAAIQELTAGLEDKVRRRTAELEQAYNELKLAQQIIADELELARLVQQSFLPEKPPLVAGWTMRAWASPAKEVGGDLYDFIPLGDGKIGVAVGDVAGKSVPAALMMAVSISILHTAAKGHPSPGQALMRLNQLLKRMMPPRMFLTMTYAILDIREHRCRIANAGGPAPLLINPLTGTANYLDITGFPLGVFSDIEYDEIDVYLKPSEMLLFYSDGLVEATDQKGDFFGFPRLEELARSAPRELDLLIDLLLNEVAAYTGGSAQYDDITMVAIQSKAEHGEENQ
ncbi:SpoIIE family protein phosphatase [Desulfotruncus alcoholivorax]|uniref:SpoIIE family protein phosphatase n=1 Tax=Desulfotruncus alcoholivorax TaxID=265477 RepID=UPI000688E411|nr:SpoIIE family protein phosphatase [Desulfotruncus alcoholivorax]